MADKPGPKKRISKVKIYEDTKGNHRVSDDGSECFIGGSRFKRTVLPSVAIPHKGDQAALNDLEEFDAPPLKEAGNEEL